MLRFGAILFATGLLRCAEAACDQSQGVSACFGNGVCRNNGQCRCDAGWEGEFCTRLKLKPANPSAHGFANGSCPVWGGTVLPSGGKWHLFSGGKYLSSIGGGAHVIHAVSDNGPAGPYAYVEEVQHKVKDWQSRVPAGLGLRSDAHMTPEGYLVIFVLTGLDGKYGLVGLVNEQGNPDGPFEPFMSYRYIKPATAVWDWGFIDPSATIKPDGSIMVVYRTDMAHDGDEHVGLLYADHWRDPLTKLTTDATGPLFTRDESNEDPYIWWSDRGMHMLFHTQEEPDGVKNRKYRGSYAFGPGDGKDISSWQISYDYAWPTTVDWSNGTTGQVVPRRQRPSLIFPAGSQELGSFAAKKPTHLITGANFFDAEWIHTDRNTMFVQEIDYSTASDGDVLV